MKVIKFIRNIIIGIIAVAFFGFAIAMTVLVLNTNKYGVPVIGDTSLLIIREDISSDKYKKGDLVLVEKRKVNKINAGDELFVFRVDDTGVPSVELGIVGEAFPSDNSIAFENGDTFGISLIVGTPSKVYDKVGTYLSVVLTKMGFLFIILVPCYLFFIYQLYNLIVEIKYGSEERS